jgi:hypothetical protein
VEKALTLLPRVGREGAGLALGLQLFRVMSSMGEGGREREKEKERAKKILTLLFFLQRLVGFRRILFSFSGTLFRPQRASERSSIAITDSSRWLGRDRYRLRW